MRNTNSVQWVRLAASRVHRAVGSVSTLGLLLDISVGQAMSCNNSCEGNDVNFVAKPRVVDHMARDLNPRRVLHRHGAKDGWLQLYPPMVSLSYSVMETF